jgi:hypothetical protein
MQSMLAIDNVISTFQKRKESRRKRFSIAGQTCMSKTCMTNIAEELEGFIVNGGCVDSLDYERVFPDVEAGTKTHHHIVFSDDQKDLQTTVENLGTFQVKMQKMAKEHTQYTVGQFHQDLNKCCMVKNNSALQLSIRDRINRFVGKIIVPIYEAHCRGVSQSSIWGCIVS